MISTYLEIKKCAKLLLLIELKKNQVHRIEVALCAAVSHVLQGLFNDNDTKPTFNSRQ